MHIDKQLVCKWVLEKGGGGAERQIYFHEGKVRKYLRTANSSCDCKPQQNKVFIWKSEYKLQDKVIFLYILF